MDYHADHLGLHAPINLIFFYLIPVSQFSSLEILSSSIELVASSFVTFISRDFANITWSFAVSASRNLSSVGINEICQSVKVR